MESPRPIRVGTRPSPLALTQTRAFVAKLESRWPEMTFTLVPVETRGDKNRAVPLSSVNDAAFFSAELDEALAAGEVDVCVHSLKDLPEERPFHAIYPEREDPRDVLLVRRDSVVALNTGGRPFTIGTSTSRRAANVIEFLDGIAPESTSDALRRELQLKDIRGNIDQRLAQLVDPEHRYDAIVLALAGLNRLWANPDARPRLAGLLAPLRWIVLPLEACPTAAGQGVLAVECRTDDHFTIELLAPLRSEAVTEAVARERELLRAVDPVERPTFGVTAVHDQQLGLIAWVRGGTSQGRLVWDAPEKPSGARGWEGSRWSSRTALQRLPTSAELAEAAALFVAHSRALPDGATPPEACRVWAAGLQTWKALARRGIWVEGCAEVLGFEALLPTLRCEVLQLPPVSAWRVLTHADAIESWEDFGIHDVVATYRLSTEVSEGAQAEVSEATHFYWTSSLQYAAVRAWLPENAQHACGPGKTFRALSRAAVAPLQVFPSVKEWRAWLA